MGGFYSSLHVWLGEGGDARRDSMIDAVRAAVVAGGTVVAADDAAEADQTVLVGAAGASPWAAVYDELVDQDVAGLDALASRLSAQLGTWALGVVVHDGDVLILRLHKDGELVDEFNSAPDYFGEATAKERRAAAGRAQRWKPLLAPSVKVGALRELFREEGEAGAEAGVDRLERLAPLLRLDPARALTSYAYLVGEGEGREALASMVRLAFRRASLPPGRGPPTLVMDRQALACEVMNEVEGDRSPGELFNPTPAFVCPAAAPLTAGFTVDARGSALEDGLLELRPEVVADVAWKGGLKDSKVRWEAVGGEGAGVFRARFRASALPLPNPTRLAMMRQSPAFREAGMWIKVNAYAGIVKLGDGDLTLRVVPDENPAGAASRAYRFRVVPELSRGDFPFACSHHAFRALRRLRRERILSALVVLRAGPAVREALAAAVERWAAFLQPSGDAAWTYVARMKERLEWRVSGTGVAGHPRWPATRASLGQHHLVLMRAGLDEQPPTLGSPRSPRGDGFAVDAGASDLVQLGLWAHAEHRSPAERADASGLLAQLVDALAEQLSVEQAFLARWDWGPVLAVNGEPTIYEEAVLRPAIGLDLWNERDLRGVTELLWLGDRFLGEVDAAALAEHAAVEPVGAARRVSLRPGHTLAQLERALAPIAPDRERWDRRY